MKLYTPKQLEKIKDNERLVRQEYAALRKVAQKRFKRLQAAGLTNKTSFKFPQTRYMEQDEVEYMLLEVSRYLKDPDTTIRGAKETRDRVLDYFSQYPQINESNYLDFLDFMNEMRGAYIGTVFDSGDAADVYNETKRIGIPRETVIEHFDVYRDHLNELQQMRPVRSVRGADHSSIMKKIKRLQ